MFVALFVVAGLAAAALGVSAVLERATPVAAAPPPPPAPLEIPTPSYPEYELEEEPTNPFGHSQAIDELNEHLFQHYMYGMVKQKVISPYYRVRYEMTGERVEWLLEGARGREDLTHGGTYRAILTRWHAGNFSRAVDEHNTLYTLMDGEIGQAERLATAEEEAELIERFYGDE